MPGFNPYSQYQKIKYDTSDQGNLILKAYDGAIRFCRAGRECIESGDTTGKGNWLTRAFDVVGELRKCLRPEAGGEVAESLNKAYAFVSHQITMANVFNKVEHLDNALLILTDLRGAWSDVIEQERRGERISR